MCEKSSLVGAHPSHFGSFHGDDTAPHDFAVSTVRYEADSAVFPWPI